MGICDFIGVWESQILVGVTGVTSRIIPGTAGVLSARLHGLWHLTAVAQQCPLQAAAGIFGICVFVTGLGCFISVFGGNLT